MAVRPAQPRLPVGPFPSRPESELKADIARLLATNPARPDIRVFAYGQGMWDANFRPAERTRGVVMGWRRRLVIWDTIERGSPDAPALSLALEPVDGSCTGHLCRLDPATAPAQLELFWRMAALTGAREARWLKVKTPAGDHQAIAFVARPDHPQYAGDLARAVKAQLLARATGAKGSGADYLNAVLAEIDKMGLIDWDLKEVAELMAAPAGA